MHTHCIAHFTSLRGTALHYLADRNFGFLQLFCLVCFFFFWCFLLLRHSFLHTNAHTQSNKTEKCKKNCWIYLFFSDLQKRLHFYFFLIVVVVVEVVVVAEGIFSVWILFHFISSIQIFDIDSLQLRMTGRTDTNKHSRKETNQKKTSANILLNASCCCCCYYLLCSINWCFFFFEWFFAYLLSIYNIAVVVVVVVSCISISINLSILSLTAPSLCNASLLPNRTRAQC